MEMKTKMTITADIDRLQFGYWDCERGLFVPVNAEEVDELKQAASALECSEALVDALAMFAANIAEMVSGDLKDVWCRLDEELSQHHLATASDKSGTRKVDTDWED